MELTREILEDVLGVFGRDVNKRFDKIEEELKEIKKILKITEIRVESHDRKFKEIGKVAVG